MRCFDQFDNDEIDGVRDNRYMPHYDVISRTRARREVGRMMEEPQNSRPSVLEYRRSRGSRQFQAAPTATLSRSHAACVSLRVFTRTAPPHSATELLWIHTNRLALRLLSISYKQMDNSWIFIKSFGYVFSTGCTG